MFNNNAKHPNSNSQKTHLSVVSYSKQDYEKKIHLRFGYTCSSKY